VIQTREIQQIRLSSATQHDHGERPRQLPQEHRANPNSEQQINQSIHSSTKKFNQITEELMLWHKKMAMSGAISSETSYIR